MGAAQMRGRVRRVAVPGLVALGFAFAAGGPAVAQEVDLDGAPLRQARLAVDLGAFDDPVLAFSRIRGLAVGPEGQVYVLQPMEGHVTVLTPEGRLVARMGRKGKGPGEFQSPAAMGILRGDLWVQDPALARITFFRDGSLRRTVTYFQARLEQGRYLAAAIPLSPARLLGVVMRSVGFGQRNPGYSAPLIVLDTAGAVLDTLAVLRESYPLRLHTGTGSMSPPFHDFPLCEVGPEGNVWILERPFAEGARSRLTLTEVSPSGDTLRTRTLTGRTVPLTDDVWDARLERMAGALEVERRKLEELARRPRTLVPATALEVGSDGRIWIARERVPGATQRRWVVLDRELRPEFVVDLPERFNAYDQVGHQMWGVQPDEFDIPHVQRWDVGEAPAPPDPEPLELRETWSVPLPPGMELAGLNAALDGRVVLRGTWGVGVLRPGEGRVQLVSAFTSLDVVGAGVRDGGLEVLDARTGRLIQVDAEGRAGAWRPWLRPGTALVGAVGACGWVALHTHPGGGVRLSVEGGVTTPVAMEAPLTLSADPSVPLVLLTEEQAPYRTGALDCSRPQPEVQVSEIPDLDLDTARWRSLPAFRHGALILRTLADAGSDARAVTIHALAPTGQMRFVRVSRFQAPMALAATLPDGGIVAVRRFEQVEVVGLQTTADPAQHPPG